MTFKIKHSGQEFRCQVDDGVIGPRWDPYSTHTVAAHNVATKREAEVYGDGLGTNRLKLYEDGKCVRREEWNCLRYSEDRGQFLKARILFRRHVGIDPEEVEATYHALPEDPMGPASRYI